MTLVDAGGSGPKSGIEAAKRLKRRVQRAKINRTINNEGKNQEGKSTSAPGNQKISLAALCLDLP